MKKKENESVLQSYRAHSKNNEVEILRSTKCGCYFCEGIYSARKVSDWSQEEGGVSSAVCPRCGMNTVIGDASGVPLTKAVLKEMNEAFYGIDAASETPETLMNYIDRYLEGKITKNKKNEDLFLLYCGTLATKGEPKAIMLLGDFSAGAAQFRPADYEAARAFYTDSHVANDPAALCALGRLYMQGRLSSKKNKMAPFECFAKAAALGSLEGACSLIDCYHFGHPVKVDDDFVYSALATAFGSSYSQFVMEKSNLGWLANFAYRLGKCVQNGWGVIRDETFALRYYLIYQFISATKAVLEGSADQKPPFFDDCAKQIHLLADALKAQEGDPVFDTDTFFDTYGDPNALEFSNKKFKLISYDPEEGRLEFEIESENPGLLVDTASLYCSFASPTVRWSFAEVSSFKNAEEGAFERIALLPDDDGWGFYHLGEDGEERAIAEIHFFEPKKDLGAEKKQ